MIVVYLSVLKDTTHSSARTYLAPVFHSCYLIPDQWISADFSSSPIDLWLISLDSFLKRKHELLSIYGDLSIAVANGNFSKTLNNYLNFLGEAYKNFRKFSHC